jgi:ABC-type Na+ efflux pump permease subunit
LRIARWEVTKNAGGIDRRTVAVAAVAIAFLGGLAPIVAGGGAVLDSGIYRVGVTGDSPYHDVVAADDTFAVRPDADGEALADGGIELLIRGRSVAHADSPKGRAAREELRTAVREYNDRNLRQDDNATAAFPVSVVLRYEERAGVGGRYRIDPGATGSGEGTGGGQTGSDTVGSGDAAGGGSSGSASDSDGADGTTTGETDASGTGSTTAGSGTAGGGGPDDGQADGGPGSDDGVATGGSAGGGGLGGLGSSFGGGAVGSPADISPPFPFESLVLAFVFVIPLNFLIQAYGSTILSERINRRGELLLVAPVSRLDVVGGKTLPYFLAAMAVEGAIAVGLTYVSRGTLGGLVSVAAVTPIVLLFLAATFLGAMFARSFKELTFVTVTITVSLTTYAFVPAIFTDVNPIALISPLTIVVRDLQGQAVAASEFVFSTAPPFLSALVLFGLGLGLYREEDMFAQRSIPLKLLDALAGRIRRRWHVAVLTAVLLPFVFVLELLAIATLFALGEVSIPLILVVVAVVEEVAKSLHVYAASVHDRFERRARTALVVGALSGVGFFVGEKITLLAQLVGLPELQIGRAGLQIGLLPGLAVLAAPLLLHVVTAAVSSLGTVRGRRGYALGLGVAIVLHLVYNYTVVIVLGG